jgi:hypothetical protein
MDCRSSVDHSVQLVVVRGVDAGLELGALGLAVDEIRDVTDALRRSLSETDRIWTRWAGFARDHGVEA